MLYARSMRRIVSLFAVSVLLGSALGGGCAASGGGDQDDDGSGAGSTTTGFGGNGVGGNGFEECAVFSAAGEQAPAAMLFVLDGSASMATAGKWQAAQLAVASAIDQDVFDTMSLGLLTFPLAAAVTGPACLLNLPVNCGFSALPQIPITPARLPLPRRSQQPRRWNSRLRIRR